MGQFKRIKTRDHDKRIQRALDSGDYREALRLAHKQQQKRPNDYAVAHNTATVYIDAGEGLKDVGLINKGIGWFEVRTREIFLPRSPEEAGLLYNLANGYAARLGLRRAQVALVKLSQERDATQQKILYRRAAQAAGQADPDLTAKSLVNFGNLLRQLGRWVEAADQYEAALDLRPRHGPALVHSAKTLFQIGHLARHGLEPHLLEIHDRLSRALRSRKSLIRIAGPKLLRQASEDIGGVLKSVEARGGLERVEERTLGREQLAASLRGDSWKFRKLWARERLFLSINARLRRHQLYWLDDIAPARLKGFDWPAGTLRIELAERLEEMIADYSVARLLFAVAELGKGGLFARVVELASPQRKHSDLEGSRLPLLKVAYRIAADILDKGAGYVNALCGLQVPERNVYIGTVWHEKGRAEKPLSHGARRAFGRNSYVRGMYDLSLDWHNTELDDHLRQIRHALTHRYLPVHLQQSLKGASGPEELTAEAMRALTVLALKTARAIILHSVGATEMEIGFRAEGSSRL